MAEKTQETNDDAIDELKKEFVRDVDPIDGNGLVLLTDNRTGAKFCECHIRASKLIEYGTVDVPLDPEDQAEYRANREVVEDAYAFQRMKEDAKLKRSFSNIVTEYSKEFDADHLTCH